MKKLVKLSSIIMALILITSAVSACGGTGSKTPRGAAKTLVSAVASDSASKLANAINLDAATRQINLDKEKADKEIRKKNETRMDEYNKRMRTLRSVKFVDYTSSNRTFDIKTAVSDSGILKIKYTYINIQGKKETLEATVSITLRKDDDSGKWFAEQSGITEIRKAVGIA
jgi:hypothetical protein